MHQLPSLPYTYSELEPYLDEPTMRLHHLKHHQGYIDKLNAALEKYPTLFNKSVEELLTDLDVVPEDIRTAVRNHGGGHWNHSFFWPILAPAGQRLREGVITLLDNSFGGLEGFKKEFKEKGLALFGSGWVWLVKKDENSLEIITTANQDSPLSLSKKPVLGLDVWEHAYYLKYQNRRADYIDAFFSVINWQKVEELLSA